MEMNNNVNVEANAQQPEVNTEATPKVPCAYQKWYKNVEEECEKLRDLAKKITEEHIAEINKLLFFYFQKGRTLGIQITKSELSVFMVFSEEKRNRLTCLPIPHYELIQFCPVAQREFFKIYIQRMNEEYGDFKAYELHTLGPEDYIETVLPWAKIIPKANKELSKNDQKPKPVDPDSDDDIRLIFSRREQNQ